MTYFIIRNSLDEKVTGRLPQIKEYQYHCDILNEPRFIGKVRFEEVAFEPILVTPILFSDSKITDLIEDGGPLSSKLLVSGKLKSILAASRANGMQFFQCSIFQKGIEFDDFFILNMFEISNHLINIPESTVKTFVKSDDFETTFMSYPKEVKYQSEKEYELALKNACSRMETFYIETLALKEPIKEDFFMLMNVEGGVGYFVSDRLKLEIEESGCTGVEFQPSFTSYNTWMAKGGLRENLYGPSY